MREGMGAVNILATGCPGWLGTRLVEALLGAVGPWPSMGGGAVRCLVQEGIDPSGLASLGASVVHGDLASDAPLGPTLRDIDIVFHLAGIIHPRRIRDLYALNTGGTRRLLEASIHAGVRRFVYVSSNSPAGVNEDPSVLLDEDSVSPYKHYGRSKRLAEELVLKASSAGRIDGVVIRPCWFYGPGQPERQTRFFRMIRSGRPIIFGTGKYWRSMSYIDDTVQGLILAALSSKAPGQVYWIADKEPYRVNRIYETIAGLLGARSLCPRHVPEWASRGCGLLDDGLQACGFYVPELHVAGEMIEHIACSIRKAEAELGYAPQVGLEEGMRRSIDWCRARGLL